MRILGVITARKGSKRLPGKNLLKIGGKTLVQRSAEFGKKLMDERLINDLIITTDCSLMMEEAHKFGCSVPFERPDYLSSDFALHVDVMRHAIHESEKFFIRRYDAVIILQPTNPFRHTQLFNSAIDIMTIGHCDSVVSYYKLNLPLKYLALLEMENIMPLINNRVETLAQKNVYCRSGNVVLVKRNVIVDGNCLGEYNRKMVEIKSDLEKVNIDTNDDYHHANYLYNKRK